MGYPLIILGAGASYDYVIGGDGLPMTNQLVDSNFINSEISSRYKEVEDLLSDLSGAIRLNDKGFEERLTEIKNESGDKKHRKDQFNALKFYLRDLFLSFLKNFANFNNYKSLIGHINDWSGGKVCIVNLNYDTFFEKSYNKKINKMQDYIDGDLKIFKIHGSCDWTHVYRKDDTARIYDIKDGYDLLKSVDYTGEEIYYTDGIDNLKFFKIPALAIPIMEKQDFICPKNHIKLLKEQLGEVDRILIIGWSAKDPAFIELIEKNLKNLSKVAIVAGGVERANEIKGRLKHLQNLKFEITTFGFSDFVADSSYCKTFFL